MIGSRRRVLRVVAGRWPCAAGASDAMAAAAVRGDPVHPAP